MQMPICQISAITRYSTAASPPSPRSQSSAQRARPLVERHGTGNTSRICADRRRARARRERCGFRPPAVAPARRFEIAVTTFQRRYFGSGQHLDIRLCLDALDKVIGHSRLQTSATGQQPYLSLRRSHVDLEFAAAQLVPEMLAQRLLVDLQLLGDVGFRWFPSI
jgi:hypothetical protein